MSDLQEALGDKYEEVKELIGDKKFILDDGTLVKANENIPRVEFNKRMDALKSQLETEIAIRDKQLEDLTKKAKGNEEMTTELEKVKGINEQSATDHAEAMRKSNIEHKFELALTTALCSDTRLYMPLLDTEKLKGVTDPASVDTIILEQVKALTEDDRHKRNFGKIKTKSPEHEEGEDHNETGDLDTLKKEYKEAEKANDTIKMVSLEMQINKAKQKEK